MADCNPWVLGIRAGCSDLEAQHRSGKLKDLLSAK